MIKKHYAIGLVNKITGEIDHVAVSDLTLADEMVGLPSNYALTHQLTRFEFEAETNGKSVLRARDLLQEIEMSGANPAQKSAANAIVKMRSGKTLLTNMQRKSQTDVGLLF